MMNIRYHDQIASVFADLGKRIFLTHVVGESNKFGVVLNGFYQPEVWDGKKSYWLSRTGEILIDSPLPEALIKVEFNIIPFQVGSGEALNLIFSQGNNILQDAKIIKQEKCCVYINVLQGINPITIHVEGNLLSPFEAVGAADSRKLSFAFQEPFEIELLA